MTILPSKNGGRGVKSFVTFVHAIGSFPQKVHKYSVNAPSG